MEPRADGDFPYELHILVCTGKSCNAEGEGQAIRDDLKALNKEMGNRERVRVCSVSCLDLCDFGPNIVVWPGGKTHHAQTLARARRLYEASVSRLPAPAGVSS